MGQARERRRRAEKKRGGRSRREEVQLDVRRRVKALLQRLKLLGEFEALPAYVRDQFYSCCAPDPVLVFDPSFPSAEAYGGKYAEVREEAIAGFRYAAIVRNRFMLEVKEFIAIAVPIAAMLRHTLASLRVPLAGAPRMPASIRAFMEKAIEPFNALCCKEAEADMYAELHSAVVVPLVGRSRLDGSLLHARLSMQETFRGHRLVMTLHAEKPATRRQRVTSNGRCEPRLTYRLGTPNTWSGIEWTSWSRASIGTKWADALGLPATDEWPVYVQEHALLRLRVRLDTYAHADWAEHWLHESLKKPAIVHQQANGDLMVAYEVQGQRLGYVVVAAGGGMVTVRTFLFLTMRNTPEGRELARRLRLTPDEVDYLRLHELSRFTRTDLKDDPKLRAIIEASGCGHLFELAEDEHALRPSARPITPFAEELKQYVGVAA